MLPSQTARMTLGTRMLIVLGKIARPITLVAVIALVILASYIFTPSESIFNEPLSEITPHQLSTVTLTILMWIVAIGVCIFLGVRLFRRPKADALENWGIWGVIAIIMIVFDLVAFLSGRR
jgi:magnesium-transporting ATPase (P-type)